MITKENVRRIIRLDTDGEPYMFKDQMYVSVPCVFSNVDMKLIDTNELVEMADEIRAKRGYKTMFAANENDADYDMWYEFGITISGPHEGNWQNHLTDLNFEVMNTEQEDNEETYTIELTDTERQIIYDHLNEICKTGIGQSCDELLKECEVEVL